jgi:hypothetical protein
MQRFCAVILLSSLFLHAYGLDLLSTTRTDLEYAATLVNSETGQITFGNRTRAMRGGEVDREFTPTSVQDEFWIHPDSKLKFVSSPRRPVKAWHSGFISSFARAAEHAAAPDDRAKYLATAEAIARFFMNSFLTPKGHPYGVHRMWDMSGKLVSWEEMQKSVQHFDLFGTPWFNADRFGVVKAPWIARAGWGDLDFLVEPFVTLYEVTQKPIYLKVAEDLASPFLNYSQLKDPRRDFCFLVRSDPGKPIGYDQFYFWSHDAEGAIHAYFRLAQAEREPTKAKRYREIAMRMADLWLQMINESIRLNEPGWPPYWMYSLDYFLPGKPISVRPRLADWTHETEEEARAQYQGADFFRIDHVPQGLVFAFNESHDLKYLKKAEEIVRWIHTQKNFDRDHVALRRVPEPRKGFLAPHNVHSDSPYMRSSLVRTHAILSDAWKNAGDAKKSTEYREWAEKGLKSLLSDRVKVGGKNYPLYSLEQGGRPIILDDQIWSDPKFEAAGLHNELYGYVYDELWSARETLDRK